jgi:hypothetical protein
MIGGLREAFENMPLDEPMTACLNVRDMQRCLREGIPKRTQPVSRT